MIFYRLASKANEQECEKKMNRCLIQNILIKEEKEIMILMNILI